MSQLKSTKMEFEKLIAALKKDFTKIINEGEFFQQGTVIYVREIKKGIFLIFSVLKNHKNEPIMAIIASFDSIESIGIKKPIQLLFHLKINNNADIQYLNTYLSTTV